MAWPQIAEKVGALHDMIDMLYAVEAGSPDPCFKLILLPVPIELHCQLDEIV